MSESFRIARLLQLQEERAANDGRLSELRQELEGLEAAETARHQKSIRAQNFDPEQGVCPRCCIDDAVTNRLLAVAFGASNPVLRCSTCGWTETA